LEHASSEVEKQSKESNLHILALLFMFYYCTQKDDIEKIWPTKQVLDRTKKYLKIIAQT